MSATAIVLLAVLSSLTGLVVGFVLGRESSKADFNECQSEWYDSYLRERELCDRLWARTRRAPTAKPPLPASPPSLPCGD